MKRKTARTFGMTCVALAAIGGHIAPAAQAQGLAPDPRAILDTYARAQDRIQAFTVHYTADLLTDNHLLDQYSRASGKERHGREGWFSQDFRRNRFLNREEYWSPSRGQTRQGAHFRLHHWDGQTYYQYMGKGGGGTVGRGNSEVARTNREHPLMYLCRGFLGKDLIGYPIQTELRLDQMLRGAQLRLLPETENVGRFRCYVIESETRFGLITAWFDPDRECSLVKYRIIQGQGDYYRGAEIEVTVDDLAEVEGLWLPAKGYAREDWQVLDGGHIRRETTVRMDSFSINPDFDAEGTFDLTRYVEDGTEWLDSESVERKYIWRNGGLVPSR